MMLDHLGDLERARCIRSAVERTLRDDAVRTPDVGGHASTDEFAGAVIRHLA
jgi:isocitrate/isopropylmalate dehydrogenase